MKNLWIIVTILLAGLSAAPASADSNGHERWTVKVRTTTPGWPEAQWGNHEHPLHRSPGNHRWAHNDHRRGHDRDQGRHWHRPRFEPSDRYSWDRPRFRRYWRHDIPCDRRPPARVPAQWTIVYRFPW